MAKGSIIELYTHSEKEVNEWITYLKLFVVLTDLKEDYKMQKILGRGNFAQVNLADNRHTKLQYALKSVDKHKLKKNKRNVTSLMLEIDILREIDHKHIIKLYEVYDKDKYIHLVLEYL